MTIPYSTGKTLSIDQLTNVNITNVTNQDVLQYDTTTNEWNNGTIDLSGQNINMNNLNITGTLSVNGSSGDTGAVLTSQATSDPIWERPYFMMAGLNNNYTQSGTSGTEIVENMTELFNGNNYNYGDWTSATNSWDCPDNGFYRITGHVRSASQNTDVLFRFNTFLSKYNSSDVFVENICKGGMDLNTDAGDEADTISSTMTRIVYLTAGEKIKLRINWIVNSGNLTVIGTAGSGSTATEEQKTYMIVERIIKGTF